MLGAGKIYDVAVLLLRHTHPKLCVGVEFNHICVSEYTYILYYI